MLDYRFPACFHFGQIIEPLQIYLHDFVCKYNQKLSANVDCSWNSRLQHSGVSARQDPGIEVLGYDSLVNYKINLLRYLPAADGPHQGDDGRHEGGEGAGRAQAEAVGQNQARSIQGKDLKNN